MTNTLPVPDLVIPQHLTATNTDVLSGTDLATAPGNGFYLIYAVSDQVDSTINISRPGAQAARDVHVLKNTTLKVNELHPWKLSVVAGVKVTISVTETTAMAFEIQTEYHSAK